MNIAEYIVKRLEELGVNDFFGLPGDYNFNLLYAVDNNPNTKWIGCTNELNAGYAADGYARIRGYGALITTYGVGELSAINAVAGSTAENVPVACIVGIPSTKFIENKTLLHHNLQDANYSAYKNAFSSVVSAATLLNKDNAKLEIDNMLKIMVKEKKPVYIAIPDDIAQMEVTDRSPYYDWVSDKNNLSKAAEKIVEKISKSQKPVIIGDTLIKRFDAQLEYKEFVTKSKIPVSNFLMGLNIIDMDYERYIGSYFGKFRNPIAQKYIEESDCIIAVGPIYSDINSFGYNLPKNINDDIAIYGNYTYIEGKKYDNIKMSDILEAITELVETKNIEIDKPNIGYKPRTTENTQLTSEYIYSRVQEFLKDNDILIAETGCVPLGVAQIKFPQNAEIQFQTLWGSIGWATPATLGACIAKPQSRVILVTGEGAHQLTAMEIGNMLRNDVKPIIILINNNGYTVERLLCQNPLEEFNDIVNVNYAKFARAFDGDIWATKVTTAEDFDKALKVTQIMNKMCYIEVCTDKMEAPQLVKDLASDMKERAKVIKPEKSTQVFEKIEDVILTDTSNDFEYETIVHKGFAEDNKNNEDTNNE